LVRVKELELPQAVKPAAMPNRHAAIAIIQTVLYRASRFRCDAKTMPKSSDVQPVIAALKMPLPE
jgi:predicted protein tyrosine phosphatase